MKFNLDTVTFHKFNDYLHTYYVPGLHDSLIPYKGKVMEVFEESHPRKTKSPDANISFIDNEFNDIYQTLLYGIVNKYYIVDNTWEGCAFAIYSQNNEDSINDLHCHINNHSLVCTFYIDPPNSNEGGELEIWDNEIQKFKSIKISKDYIYFFPGWLLHRPLPQTSTIPRVCFNWGYRSSLKPLHRLTGDIW